MDPRAEVTAAIQAAGGLDKLLAMLAWVREAEHRDAVLRNWEVFHVDPPTDYRDYVYLYYCGEYLIYVGMTSDALNRASGKSAKDRHWKKSFWWSWVDSVEYIQCPNRKAAYKLESMFQKNRKPVFWRTRGDEVKFRQITEQVGNNHVLGTCDCLDRSTDLAYLERYENGTVVPAV